MSDRNTITSKDGKYKGVLQETDGNFVVYRTADSKRIAALGATDPDPITPTPTPTPEPEPRAPPESVVAMGIDISGWRPPANQRSLILRTREIIIAVVLLFGLLYLVFS